MSSSLLLFSGTSADHGGNIRGRQTSTSSTVVVSGTASCATGVENCTSSSLRVENTSHRGRARQQLTKAPVLLVSVLIPLRLLVNGSSTQCRLRKATTRRFSERFRCSITFTSRARLGDHRAKISRKLTKAAKTRTTFKHCKFPSDLSIHLSVHENSF